MPHERIFEEREVSRIIRRALEHQHAEPDRRGEVGLTLHELERLGAEVGLRPEHLRRAAAEADLPEVPSIQRVSVGLYEVHTERWIPGRLSDAEIETMFAEIKHRLGSDLSSWSWGDQRGSGVERLGQTLAMQLDINGATRLAVTEHGEGHVLRVSRSLMAARRSDSIVVGTMLAFVLAILPVAAAAEWLGLVWAVLVGVLTLGASIAATHRWTERTRLRGEQKVQAVADTATRLLQPRAAASAQVPVRSSGDEPERARPLLGVIEPEDALSGPGAGRRRVR